MIVFVLRRTEGVHIFIFQRLKSAHDLTEHAPLHVHSASRSWRRKALRQAVTRVCIRVIGAPVA